MPQSLYPSLRYRDADAAIDFLQRAFGFEEGHVYRDDAGRVAHAEFRHDGSVLMFGSETDEGVARSGSHAGQGWVYVAVDDPDALHDRAKAAGAEIVMGLTDQEYGSRDFAARDPEGNLWSFGTYRPTAG
jgi:uncharacterized glyoxalase superfamily protein PhnB